LAVVLDEAHYLRGYLAGAWLIFDLPEAVTPVHVLPNLRHQLILILQGVLSRRNKASPSKLLWLSSWKSRYLKALLLFSIQLWCPRLGVIFLGVFQDSVVIFQYGGYLQHT